MSLLHLKWSSQRQANKRGSRVQRELAKDGDSTFKSWEQLIAGWAKMSMACSRTNPSPSQSMRQSRRGLSVPLTRTWGSVQKQRGWCLLAILVLSSWREEDQGPRSSSDTQWFWGSARTGGEPISTRKPRHVAYVSKLGQAGTETQTPVLPCSYGGFPVVILCLWFSK